MGSKTVRPPMEIEVDCPDCGSIFMHQPHGSQKARSPEQHRRFFLMVALGYRNLLPENKNKCINAEHYRAKVTMRAGADYREVAGRLPVPHGISKEDAYQLVLGALRISILGGLYYHSQVEGDEIVWYRARSVRWLQMGHRKFNLLNEIVQEMVEKDTGRDVDEMIKEHFDQKAAEKGLRAGRERAPRDIGREF